MTREAPPHERLARELGAAYKDDRATHGDLREAVTTLEETGRTARRVLGENVETTLKLRWIYADALYEDPDAALDDLREAVTTLEETTQIARRVLGAAHPVTAEIEYYLRDARAALRARGGNG